MYPLLSLPFEEEMYPTENLPFGSLLYVQNDLPFAFCQDDRRIAMFFAPGHYRAAFVVPVPEPLLSATLTVLHSRLMTRITGIKLTAGPGITLYDASKQHVHGKFHILSLESIFLETYLALEMSLSNV